MTSNFWASSHYNHWIIDRISLGQSREDDLKYATAEELAVISIFFANMIARLGKRLGIRAQVVATAIVYFKRYYLKNNFCETDPYVVVPTCLYVATKIEEVPLHFKPIATETKNMYQQDYGLQITMPDPQSIAEMEFYLLEDLDFHLIMHHPYRTLMQLCGESSASRSGGESEEGEAGEGLVDARRFWSTGKGTLQFEENARSQAWCVASFDRHIVNDTLRGDFCLLYHPHLIAIAAIFLTLVLDDDARARIDQTDAPARGYATRSKAPSDPLPNPVDFLASLNVSYGTVAQIVQEIISLWALWGRHQVGEADADRNRLQSARPGSQGQGMSDEGVIKKLLEMQRARRKDEGQGVPSRLFEKPKPPKVVKKP
ncbi:C/H/G cyclin [Dacryopinax primogenitus]|uniref:C/H/G cyclin n=1 Tax=Dacryopinax primogenitus (strain DJM 731) TaxID=1858805 RepID=M5FQM7_DACPD|nr:C/H/G cyclin [Dacryopinax primogenitus]EJT99205.1 C/H/G cyclin [Dacryopinax primogenitus]